MAWVSNRVAAIALVAVTATLVSCGGGGDGGGSAQLQNRAPVAANDAMRADGDALKAVDVLSNDDLSSNRSSLTVAIEAAASIGTASVNADKSIQITDLPEGFKGVTHFSYRVSDANGASSIAAAAIFVGTDPFRVVFAGDAQANHSPEVYLTDFAAAPKAVTAATDGNLRLRGFAAAENGSVVVYRRADTTNAATTDLSFVKTTGASPQAVDIEFPDGALPVQDAAGDDQYRVSADGKWIAAVAGANGADALYVLNVESPSTITKVSPVDAQHVTQLYFSTNSASLYFLATADADGGNRKLYTVSPGSPSAAVQISASAAGANDDITAYSVSSDQARVALQANRGGQVGLYFIDSTQLQVEVPIHTPGSSDTILASTIGLSPEQGGSARGDRVAYTVQSGFNFRVYHASVSATPAPQVLPALGARVIGFRPDDAALLYSRLGQIYEWQLDGANDQLVGVGAQGWYDSTGNIVVLKQFLPSGGTPSAYTALAVSTRASFGGTEPLGTPVLAAHYVNLSGVGRGVVILGEGPTVGAAPSSARLALVSALAPEKLQYLADFESPLNLTSETARVVSQ